MIGIWIDPLLVFGFGLENNFLHVWKLCLKLTNFRVDSLTSWITAHLLWIWWILEFFSVFRYLSPIYRGWLHSLGTCWEDYFFKYFQHYWQSAQNCNLREKLNSKQYYLAKWVFHSQRLLFGWIAYICTSTLVCCSFLKRSWLCSLTSGLCCPATERPSSGFGSSLL